ncbi:cell division protein FtsL [Thioalkalicoccus limnaeus]|uniref:Cell division protein FtsL n=1 Tax=Thioalkalicoccus limnaeus TaxID=120681 RepID=A0ABV4BH27_9GAMM
MRRLGSSVILLLGLSVILSGVAVVYAKYLTRAEFIELQELRAERDALAVEWGWLRLEEATLTTHARVEELARRNLDMYLPHRRDIRLIWGDN